MTQRDPIAKEFTAGFDRATEIDTAIANKIVRLVAHRIRYEEWRAKHHPDPRRRAIAKARADAIRDTAKLMIESSQSISTWPR